MAIVAIQPDDYTDPCGRNRPDASSPRWEQLLTNAGHTVRWVDVHRADILDQLKGCHGFMWRYGHCGFMSQLARSLLPVLERRLGLVVYPDDDTCWHYDNKIAQCYLLKSLELPTPMTWVWHAYEQAAAWVKTADYPLVMKLAGGAGSSNVRLIHGAAEATDYLRLVFGEGVYSLAAPDSAAWSWSKRLKTASRVLRRGRLPASLPPPFPLQRGQILFQEYLPGNLYDTRITVIGHRAFGFRRFNRAGDFRASGSGLLDTDPSQIEPDAVRLAFDVAESLNAQSVAIDILRAANRPVVCEVSYTYASWAVRDCPGHWTRSGASGGGRLLWSDGPMWPEEAQVEAFLERLQARLSHAA